MGKTSNSKRIKQRYTSERIVIIMYNKKYYQTHKKESKLYRNKRKKLKPWFDSYNNARQRCNNTKHLKYHCYGGRGIKFLLTEDECVKLWERDKGWLLKQHSIDRKDNDGHYEYSNCQFIEMKENIKVFIKQARLSKEHPSYLFCCNK